MIGFVNCALLFAMVGAPLFMVWHAFHGGKR